MNNLARKFLMKHFLIRICHSLTSKCSTREFPFLTNFQRNPGRFPRQLSLPVCLSVFSTALLAGSKGSWAYRLLHFGADRVLRAGKEGPTSLWLLGSPNSPDMQGSRLTGCPGAEASCHEKTQHSLASFQILKY